MLSVAIRFHSLPLAALGKYIFSPHGKLELFALFVVENEVFFHNGLHGLYGFLSLGGSCHSDCSASGHRRLLRRKIRIIRAIRCKNISEI